MLHLTFLLSFSAVITTKSKTFRVVDMVLFSILNKNLFQQNQYTSKRCLDLTPWGRQM